MANLLTPSQALAICKAVSEFNNIGAVFAGTLKLSRRIRFTAWPEGDFTVTMDGTSVTNETYDNFTEFCTAYGLN